MPDAAPNLILLTKGDIFRERYHVIRPLGMGAMGAVYEVFDHMTNAPRALKVMLPNLRSDDHMRARFAAEAKATGGIESDHVVRVFDAGVDPVTQMSFLVMELLRGQSLENLIASHGPLPQSLLIFLVFQMAWALDKTHKAGIVHRDLKPANLFITTRDDGSPCLKILDFGIAKLISSSVHTQSGVIGTPLFMAPEQLRNPRQVGPQTDLFALGHIVFFALTGHHYWQEEVRECETPYMLIDTLHAGIVEAPTARAARKYSVNLPAAFDAWMLRTTAAQPSARFSSATECAEALACAFGERWSSDTRVPMDMKGRSTLTSSPGEGLASQPEIARLVGTPSLTQSGASLPKSAPHNYFQFFSGSKEKPRIGKSYGALAFSLVVILAAWLGYGALTRIRQPTSGNVAPPQQSGASAPSFESLTVDLPVSAAPVVTPSASLLPIASAPGAVSITPTPSTSPHRQTQPAARPPQTPLRTPERTIF